MPRFKAPKILRSEAYLDVRRNDKEFGQRRRWVFFSSLKQRRLWIGPIAFFDPSAWKQAEIKKAMGREAAHGLTSQVKSL
jgi:hypothetical protein